MNKPENWMPWWLYLLLSKGIKWQRTMMDEGAMGSFDIDTAADPVHGKREVMGGISEVLANENLVNWTVRHEMGHSVDQQIKFMETRGKLNMFGGWRMYENDTLRKEVAKVFLTKAGFSDTEQTTKVMNLSLLDIANTSIGVVKKGGRSPAQKFTEAVDGIANLFAPKIGLEEAKIKEKAADFEKYVAVAFGSPWTFSDGGGSDVTDGGRMYHVDHYGTWISYLAAARGSALSNYQFSSPGEWFAESYAAFYEPKKNGDARARMPDEVKQWFTINLGPPSFSRDEGKKSTGALADDKGQLGTLKDLDDQVAAALNDPTKTVKVLPDDLQHLLADTS